MLFSFGVAHIPNLSHLLVNDLPSEQVSRQPLDLLSFAKRKSRACGVMLGNSRKAEQ